MFYKVLFLSLCLRVHKGRGKGRKETGGRGRGGQGGEEGGQGGCRSPGLMSGEGRVKGVRSPGLMSGDTLPSYLSHGTYDVTYPHSVNRQML